MSLKNIFLILMLCLASHAFSQGSVNVIFDSDMGPDYDDVGAITMLHAFADNGEVKILATMASTRYEGVAGVLNVFNTYFNRPGIPVGVPKGNAPDLRDWQHWTDTILVKYPHRIKANQQADDAVALYRKVLAVQPDRSVTIVTVGFLTNLSGLLNTKGDAASPLSGYDLVRRKVKQLICMAGKFPSGSEFNVMKDAAASKNVFTNWPSPVIFSGFGIGDQIKTGLPLVHNTSIKNSPVKDVFRIAIPKAAEDSLGRSSWDETAVLIAVRGYSHWYTIHKGRMIVADDGSNSWDENGTGQAFIVEKADTRSAVQDLINMLIQHQPTGKVVGKRTTGKVQATGRSRMSNSTKSRIAQIEALSRKIDKIEANIKRREKEIAKAEQQEK